jgi:hypothetical protein
MHIPIALLDILHPASFLPLSFIAPGRKLILSDQRKLLLEERRNRCV